MHAATRPRIGITTWPRPVPVGDLEEPNETVPRAYVRAIVKAGGLPVLLPVVDADDVDALLDVVDSLVVSGGGDVDPATYGQAATTGLDRVDHRRDDFDIALWRAVLERPLPALGICRGTQILNVALGGSLLQHIDGHRSTVHAVTTTGGGAFTVNSLHHQAVDRLGDGVRATARAADGTIEALEVDGAPHIVAVQWHPELLRHEPAQLALFERLCRR